MTPSNVPMEFQIEVEGKAPGVAGPFSFNILVEADSGGGTDDVLRLTITGLAGEDVCAAGDEKPSGSEELASPAIPNQG